MAQIHYIYRSIDYTINGFYKNHITVFAEVVPVALELSKDELTVEPHIGLPADAGTYCLGLMNQDAKLSFSIHIQNI